MCVCVCACVRACVRACACITCILDKVLLGRAVCSIEQEASHVLVTDIHSNVYKVGLLSLSLSDGS